jgi:HSP20 family protein
MTERYTPFEEFDRLFENMYENMYNSMRAMPMGMAEESEFGRGHGHGTGNVRMERSDEGFVVIADLPGFERDEIDVRLTDGVLTIEADNRVEDESSVRSRHMMEQVRVPDSVHVEDVTATYQNGVLEITFPMDEDGDDTHHIQIE